MVPVKFDNIVGFLQYRSSGAVSWCYAQNVQVTNDSSSSTLVFVIDDIVIILFRPEDKHWKVLESSATYTFCIYTSLARYQRLKTNNFVNDLTLATILQIVRVSVVST